MGPNAPPRAPRPPVCACASDAAGGGERLARGRQNRTVPSTFRITFEQYGTAGLVPCHNDGRTAPEVVESASALDQALRRNPAPIIAALAQAHGVDLSEFGRQQPEVDRSPKFVSRTCGRIHRIPPDPRATAGAAGRCPRAVSRSRTGEICGRHAKTIGPRLRTNSCTRCLR